MRYLAIGFLLACGLGLIFIGAGFGRTHEPAPRPIRPATVSERLDHDQQGRQDLIEACVGQPAVWPCTEVER